MTLVLNGCILLLREHHLLKKAEVVFDNEITAVTYDSRKAQKDGMFFCKGTNFKEDYLKSAQKNGATTYVSEVEYSDVKGMNALIVTDVTKAMALLGAAFYNYPQDDLYVIAYTGTKGKTTSSYFAYNILQDYTNGKTALFSTVNTILGPKPEDKFKSELTTPESLDLFRNMRKAVDNGMTHLVMEVSSQAYLRNRVYGLHYDVGFFLNITPDHIGPNEHPNFANYLHCKLQLLVNSDHCVINADSKHIEEIYQAAKATTDPDKIYLFAREGHNDAHADFVYHSEETTLAESKFTLKSKTEKASKLLVDGEYQLSLIGDFNETNATAAIIGAGLAGAPHQLAQNAIYDVQIPGRMESLKTKHHGTIYIDYAHNYASMKALLSFLTRETKNPKVLVVVGSPGDKGVDRRAGFSKVLTEYATDAFLTTDDPGFEDPKDICDQIDAKIDHKKVNTKIILDRETAIKTAISESKPGDIVVLAAKGEDPYQKINGVDTPYPNDYNVAKDVINKIDK